MTDQVLKATIDQAVESRADEIRAKTRADNADELDTVGHPDAAQYLRSTPPAR